MSEWFKVAVLKTVVLYSTVGSNPTCSAIGQYKAGMCSQPFYLEGNELYKFIMAGVLISIGAYANMSLGGIMGSVLFSLGLLSVIEFKTPLYTGLVSNLSSYRNKKYLLSVLLFNALGAIAFGLLVYPSDFHSYVTIIDKLDKSLVDIMVDAIVCGSCVSIAVKSRRELMTVFSVAIFVLCGGEHCIADAFYFAASGHLMDIVSIIESMLFIVYVAIGNTIGGLAFSKIELKRM